MAHKGLPGEVGCGEEMLEIDREKNLKRPSKRKTNLGKHVAASGKRRRPAENLLKGGKRKIKPTKNGRAGAAETEEKEGDDS